VASRAQIQKDEEASKKHAASVLDCNIEAWLPTLKDVTFETRFVPLSMDDAKFFLAAYKENKKLTSVPTHTSQESATTKVSASVTSSPSAATPTPDPAVNQFTDTKLRSQLATLSARLQRTMDECRTAEPPSTTAAKSDGKSSGRAASGVFVKLSCRSAKDALTREQLRALYANFCTLDNADDDNARLIALVKAATEILQVHTAAESLSQLLTSDRIFEDLTLAMAHPDRFEQNIIVRRWVHIDVDMEFRGFVYNNALNALSQYNYVTYFPRLAKQKDDLAQRILQFFNARVRAPLEQKQYNNYVIDFAVTGAALDHIWVIELNPWSSATDSALFSFREEANTILSRGPFEIRVRSEVHPQVSEMLQRNLKNFI